MSADGGDRVRAHLERRTRLAAELERLGGEAERLSEAGRERTPWWLRARAGAGTGNAPVAAPRAAHPAVTVVIPVHNAPAELRACLRALSRHTTYPAALLLIDDASTDPEIDELLEMAAGLAGAQVLRNVQNLGFTATVNRALRTAVGDVVLLNSDTAVGPRWLEQLVGAAYAAPEIGTVTPVSDNAGAFSVPVAGAANPLPACARSGRRGAAARGGGLRRPGRRRRPAAGSACTSSARRSKLSASSTPSPSRGATARRTTSACGRCARAGVTSSTAARSSTMRARRRSARPSRRCRRVPGQSSTSATRTTPTASARSSAAPRSRRCARSGRAPCSRARAAASAPALLFVIHDGGGGAIATNLDLMRALQDEFDVLHVQLRSPDAAARGDRPAAS